MIKINKKIILILVLFIEIIAILVYFIHLINKNNEYKNLLVLYEEIHQYNINYEQRSPKTPVYEERNILTMEAIARTNEDFFISISERILTKNDGISSARASMNWEDYIEDQGDVLYNGFQEIFARLDMELYFTSDMSGIHYRYKKDEDGICGILYISNDKENVVVEILNSLGYCYKISDFLYAYSYNNAFEKLLH